jgi:hypothetical protein
MTRSFRKTLAKIVWAMLVVASMSGNVLRADHDHSGEGDTEIANCNNGGNCDCCRGWACPARHSAACPDSHHDCRHHPGTSCDN